MMMTSFPIASRTCTASPMQRASPPRTPRVARLRMKTPESSTCRCIRMRSPRIAPPVNGLVGSTARTPTVWPAPRKAAISASVNVLLPAPARTGDTNDMCPPRMGKEAPDRSLRLRLLLLQAPDQPGSRAHTAFYNISHGIHGGHLTQRPLKMQAVVERDGVGEKDVGQFRTIHTKISRIATFHMSSLGEPYAFTCTAPPPPDGR